MRQREQETQEELKRLVHHLDTEEWEKDIARIDSTSYRSDRQLEKECHDAAMKLRIFISVTELRKLVKKYIDKDASDAHHDLKALKMSDFEQIPIILTGGEEEEDE